MEKYCTAGEAVDGNMAHAHCVLENWGYKYTHKVQKLEVVITHLQNNCKGFSEIYFYCKNHV